MPDPSEELITILVEIRNGTRLARPSSRLRPLPIGRPQPKRRMETRSAQTTINATLARSKAAAAPLELAHG
jgi:hypothetical protein